MTLHIDIFDKLRHYPSESLESETLEFKEYRDVNSLHGSKELADEVVALANLKGGKIIIGVADSSNIKNENWPSQLKGFPECDCLEVQERIKGKLNPRISLAVKQTKYDGKNYLVINVPKHDKSLVATTSGKFHIRDGRSSRPMTPHEIESAVKALPAYDWSMDTIQISTSDALDANFVADAKERYSYLRKLKELSDDNFFESVGITSNGQLTKGGLLFLGKKPIIEKEIGIYEFRFSWKTKSGELKKNDVWNGCLWEAIIRAKSHFDACNTNSEFEWKGVIHRFPALDSVAFHEAFLNAIAHRDYSKEGMVSIDYSQKKMTITSPGGFYGGVTPNNIFKHQPRHRNRSLAKILMTYELVDRAGMGVKRISLRSLKYGRNFPKFAEIDDSVQVTMGADSLRGGVFIISETLKDDCGLAELMVLNCIYGVDRAPIAEAEEKISIFSDSPWDELISAVDTLKRYADLSGDRDDIYIKAKTIYHDLFDITKKPKSSKVSEKLIKLYKYLKENRSASNSDLCVVLGYAHSSQTSGFLAKTTFVMREGSGKKAVWKLKHATNS